jgi:hypothetical protein
VVAPVPCKLLSAAEAGGADVDAVAGFADWICAFDSDRVGEIAAAAVAFDLEARLCHGCWASGVEMGGEEEGTDSGFPRVAGAASSCG